MFDPAVPPLVDRRAVLRATAVGAGALAVPGRVTAAGGDDDGSDRDSGRCPGSQLEPGHTSAPCGSASTRGCPTDRETDEAVYEQTSALVEGTRASLKRTYGTVGDLVEYGYLPYFDVASPGSEGGFSHWLNPDYINDTRAKPDPRAPESVVVDNRWWRPIGAMYVATDEGDPVDDPGTLWGYEHDGGRCSPWHAHDGVPGRFAWWYYRQVYERPDGRFPVSFPCVTPCVMHTWVYPAPAGPHGASADAPLPGDRGGPPANAAGLDTPADPGAEDLSLSALPEAVRREAMPDRLRRELEVIEFIEDELLARLSLTDLEAFLRDYLE